jgi:predicted nucleotidyltransferase
MANVKLRDRDGIITKDGIIFRVFGYTHPRGVYFCDAEYGSANIFNSKDPRALRNGGGSGKVFYKFYDDEGYKFVFNSYPQYTVPHKMLNVNVVGIKKTDPTEIHQPQKRLQALIKGKPADKLHAAMLRVLDTAQKHSNLQTKDFGVFGSMLYGFHHPEYSDIDLLVYGIPQIAKMREVLNDLYSDGLSGFRNEFATDAPIRGKKWRFKNLTPKEFVWHQKRKFIYGLYDDDRESGRTIKAEFEPVKDWSEIANEYNPETKIERKGWVEVKGRITADTDAPYIPSIYGIQSLEVIKGSKKALEATRIISFMEEFRLQAKRDETIMVNGNLEEVTTPEGSFYQIVLTYGQKYYDQVLKVADLKL